MLSGFSSTDLALAAHREALGILMSKLEKTRLCVIYIPSPLTAYRLAEDGSKGEGQASPGPDPAASLGAEGPRAGALPHSR